MRDRAPLRLKNRTNYFDPDTDKAVVEFVNPLSWKAKTSKIHGYEMRLYWEYKFCDDVGGQTFYYTLTYNDLHLPRYEGINCFDYNDLVYLLNGGLKKQLLRKFGTDLKYFVGAELGEGAGKRGMHNNPHYHVLFFLRPTNNHKYQYVRICPREFRSLVKKYWQGFDETSGNKQDYRTAKFGIAKEGENCGLVDSYRAISYVSKYCCKDAGLVKFAKNLERELALRFQPELAEMPSTLESFFYEYINPRYNLPLKPHLDELVHNDYQFSPSELLEFLDNDKFRELKQFHYDSDIPFLHIVHTLICILNLQTALHEYTQKLVYEKVHEKVCEFRNRYSNKCRISHGVGDYALEHIKDINSPTISIPQKKGFKSFPITQYYYRKLFTDVVRNDNGNPIRVLNELGINYRCSRLQYTLDNFVTDIKSKVSAVDEYLYDKIISSPLNYSVNLSYKQFNEKLHDLNEQESFKRFAEYETIYKGHYFEISRSDSHPPIDIFSDYRLFLLPSYFQVDFCPCRVNFFLENIPDNYLSFEEHNYFYPFFRVFCVLRLIRDYFSVCLDKTKESEEFKRRSVYKFHKRRELVQYYKQFNF